MLILILVVTKVLLGLLLSGVLAFGIYLLSIPILTAFWQFGSINGLVVTVLTTSIGAGLGAFLAWFERDQKVTFRILIFGAIFACALTGAYFGLLRGIELEPNQPDWKYGLPVLSVSIRGAVISANVPPLVIAALKGIRNFRF